MPVLKVLSKKYDSSSDESIENLLYYKDCQRKPNVSPTPLKHRVLDTPPLEPRQPDCPFPKMCCSMSCGNDCNAPQSYLSRQMEPLQNFDPIKPIQSPPIQPILPIQPPIMQRSRKKKIKPANPTITLGGMGGMGGMGGRRDGGFTKEKIKGLISQDQDIRKILKDLVRVTMKKVDLLEVINTRRNNIVMSTAAPVVNSEEYE